MDIQKIEAAANLRELLRRANRVDPMIAVVGVRPGFIPATGYHAYAELKLPKKLSAPDNQSDAETALQAITATTRLADRCVREEGGELLEAQGEIIHLFLPQSTDAKADYLRLVRFARALTVTTYQVVRKICGSDWNGFAMAADSGPSVIVTTESRSVISLGPVANRPAKKLAEGVPSGHIAIRNGDKWDEIDLLETIRIDDEDRRKSARFSAIAAEVRQSLPRLGVQYLPRWDRRSFEFVGKKQAVAVFGHVVRADLHGFSARVERAFASTEEIRKLVQQFYALVLHAEQVLRSFPHHDSQALPWAGDCLNAVLFPMSGESFSDSQGKLPPQFGAHWHSKFDDSTQWTVGIAGGDAEESSPAVNGRVLLATIQTEHRDFLVAVGWGTGMSLRAQEAKGARAKDTVITREDYRALEDVLKTLFSALLDPRYYRANALSPEKLKEHVQEKGVATAISSAPAAKPWVLE